MPNLREKIEASAMARLAGHSPADELGRYKAFLKVESHRLKMRHGAGGSGSDVCHGRALLVDVLIRHLWDTAKAGMSPQAQKEFPSLALVALGGYGRGELNPLSDLDIMFLHSGQVVVGTKPLPSLSKLMDGILTPLWDLGFKVGHSVRTLAECVEAANDKRDAKSMESKTALIEARLVTGDSKLFDKLQRTVVAKCVEGYEEAYIVSRMKDQSGRRARFGNSATMHDAAVADAPVVIHLAHGGGGETWEDIKRSMVDGTSVIAEACLRHKSKRLIYLGTIASLYLGDGSERITGNTPNDPQAETRALYSRGKALCEDILNKLHCEQKLPVVILRPGVVIGEGGMPFHSGVGFANQEGHMIGWNNGSNPLPFILVEDCASAIAGAMKAPGIEGKSYNLVGDQRPSAQQYMQELSVALGRPVRFYPQSVLKLQLIEIGKWIIKRATGRKDAPFPSYRDLKSRGLVAPFDTSDAKRDLGWLPIQDTQAFIQRGIAIHRKHD